MPSSTLVSKAKLMAEHSENSNHQQTHDAHMENSRLETETHDEVCEIFQPRPSTPRRSTEPFSPSLLNPLGQPRQRNRSPYSRAHYRSHSGSSPAVAPPMTRAHSLPAVMSHSSPPTLVPTVPLLRPSSPLRSPVRARSPYRLGEDSYSYAGTPSVPDISEDAELDLTPKAMHSDRGVASLPLSNFNMSNTFPRRRRPASPLHQVASANSSNSFYSTPTSSASSSPMLSAIKYNEPFPIGFPTSLSSSVPSTPTSTRSRSPSISSLETIPDTPDAEAEAIEEDRIAKLKAIEEGPRRGSLDEPTKRISFTNRDKRKRWSVCGGERRQDLDLETIYED
ncbi:hypothetical protein EJ05DRAFT_501206 [Pseudovirgaria hyperparasitica]|uniref:Basic proline-rich protein n=1 Tax=Pseudovirgaria hyperparasitica TaxID=470096 RepID=A0A6A6W6U1_9PEZI|nr:uncharacterized protein EJ05DRAFT_501206 [Pseudovirgaria hyperparasitica]KAF2757680.1 hypothetical protein EJ05DRAFT_501206 [Pseudovirgaria hyperparasitica]